MKRVLEVPLEPTPATTFRAFLVAEGLAAGDELIVDGHRTLIDGEPIERINAEN